jgi:hypothetical protein
MKKKKKSIIPQDPVQASDFMVDLPTFAAGFFGIISQPENFSNKRHPIKGDEFIVQNHFPAPTRIRPIFGLVSKIY